MNSPNNKRPLDDQTYGQLGGKKDDLGYIDDDTGHRREKALRTVRDAATQGDACALGAHNLKQGDESTKTTAPPASTKLLKIQESSTMAVLDRQETSSDVASNKKNKKQKARDKKPEGMPKRPLSAYNLFFQYQRQLLLGDDANEYPVIDQNKRKHRKTHGKMGFTEMARIVGERWKALTGFEREPYIQQAFEQKELYSRELEAWQRTQSSDPHPKNESAAVEATASSKGSVGPLLYTESVLQKDDPLLHGITVSQMSNNMLVDRPDRRWSSSTATDNQHPEPTRNPMYAAALKSENGRDNEGLSQWLGAPSSTSVPTTTYDTHMARSAHLMRGDGWPRSDSRHASLSTILPNNYISGGTAGLVSMIAPGFSRRASLPNIQTTHHHHVPRISHLDASAEVWQQHSYNNSSSNTAALQQQQEYEDDLLLQQMEEIYQDRLAKDQQRLSEVQALRRASFQGPMSSTVPHFYPVVRAQSRLMISDNAAQLGRMDAASQPLYYRHSASGTSTDAMGYMHRPACEQIEAQSQDQLFQPTFGLPQGMAATTRRELRMTELLAMQRAELAAIAEAEERLGLRRAYLQGRDSGNAGDRPNVAEEKIDR